MLPNLHVFNARPVDKYTKNEKGTRVVAVDDSSLNIAVKQETQKEEQKANENVSDQKLLVHRDEEGNSIKKKKRHHVPNEDFSNHEDATDLEESKRKKLKKKGKQQSELDIIDDADTPFLELFSDDKMVEAEEGGKNKVNDKASQDTNLLGGLVTFTSTKAKKRITGSTLPLLPVDEIGVGGLSTWGDD